MVIIARELAVTVMRMGATQAGVIIPASNLAKLKTCVQIAAILSVIAVHGHPAWVNALVYAAVAITVISGLDYFFGLRRMLREADERRRAAARLVSSSVPCMQLGRPLAAAGSWPPAHILDSMGPRS